MAITTGDGYIASAKQVIPYTKTAALTTVATTRYTVFGQAGNPGAGTLAAATGTPTGLVYTDGTTGMPIINAFGGSNTGYLTRVQYASSVVGRLELWDKLYGCLVTTAQLGTLQTLTLSSQPSYSSRVPGGTDYSGLRIFVEITTTMSATATTITCTYTNQSGTTAKSTASSGSLSGFVAGRWVELALAAGDTGVQKIETIVIGGATNAAGALNVIVARPLWTNRVPIANGGGVDGIDRTGMPQVWADSALVLTTVADSTSAGIPDLNIEIANG